MTLNPNHFPDLTGLVEHALREGGDPESAVMALLLAAATAARGAGIEHRLPELTEFAFRAVHDGKVRVS